MSELEVQALAFSFVLMAVLGVALWAFESVSVQAGGRNRVDRSRQAKTSQPQGHYRPMAHFGPRDGNRALAAYRSLAVVPIVALLLGVLWWS